MYIKVKTKGYEKQMYASCNFTDLVRYSICKIVLPPIFSDNMVLQQQTNAPIWGEAQPMKTVKVTTSWDGKTYAVQADKAGKWKVTVHTPVAGGPYEIALTDGKKVSLKM